MKFTKERKIELAFIIAAFVAGLLICSITSGCAKTHKLEYYDLTLGVDKSRDWDSDNDKTNIGAKATFRFKP